MAGLDVAEINAVEYALAYWFHNLGPGWIEIDDDDLGSYDAPRRTALWLIVSSQCAEKRYRGEVYAVGGPERVQCELIVTGLYRSLPDHIRAKLVARYPWIYNHETIPEYLCKHFGWDGHEVRFAGDSRMQIRLTTDGLTAANDVRAGFASKATSLEKNCAMIALEFAQILKAGRILSCKTLNRKGEGGNTRAIAVATASVGPTVINNQLDLTAILEIVRMLAPRPTSATSPIGCDEATATGSNLKSGKKDLKSVVERLHRLRKQGEPYTSQVVLAKQLGVSKSQVNKAIESDPQLRAWMNSGMSRTDDAKSVPTVHLSEAMLAGTPETREEDPSTSMSAGDVERVLQRLIAEAPIEHRPLLQSQLDRSSAEQKRRMAEVYSNTFDL